MSVVNDVLIGFAKFYFIYFVYSFVVAGLCVVLKFNNLNNHNMAKKINKKERFIKCKKIFKVIDKICEIDSDDSMDEIYLDNTAKFLSKKMGISIENCKHLQQRTNDNKDQTGFFSIKCNKLGKFSLPKRGLNDMENPMENCTENEFEKFYRFNKETVRDILNMILYGLTKHTNRGQPIPPIIELLITLRFLSSGSYQSKMNLNVSQPTISRIIKKITTLLSELKLRFIKIPAKSENQKIQQQFYKNGKFPEVFGCVGSTHIAIKSPSKTLAHDYLNENGFYSFRILIICGPNLEFYEIISRWPGATNENKIFNISEIYQRFEYKQIDGIILSNQNYVIKSFVMPPIYNRLPRNNKEWNYNDAHKRTYCIPMAINLWKQRFKCLQMTLNNNEDTTQSIITACAVLHNIAIQRKQNLSINELNARPLFNNKTNKDINLKRSLLYEPLGILEQEYFIQKYF